MQVEIDYRIVKLLQAKAERQGVQLQELLEAFARSGWVSVDAKLPDHTGAVNVLCNDMTSQWVETLVYDGKFWVFTDNCEHYPAIVSHWQPLPSVK